MWCKYSFWMNQCLWSMLAIQCYVGIISYVQGPGVWAPVLSPTIWWSLSLSVHCSQVSMGAWSQGDWDWQSAGAGEHTGPLEAGGDMGHDVLVERGRKWKRILFIQNDKNDPIYYYY